MDIKEVKTKVIQLKNVDFSTCEGYLTDNIGNYGHSSDEILQLNLELIQLYISSG